MEARLRRKAEEAGGLCAKFIPDFKPGMPDRLVVLPGGILVWVELKRPKGGRLSPLQLLRHKELAALGQRVAVVWTKEQANALICELTAPHKDG